MPNKPEYSPSDVILPDWYNTKALSGEDVPPGWLHTWENGVGDGCMYLWEPWSKCGNNYAVVWGGDKAADETDPTPAVWMLQYYPGSRAGAHGMQPLGYADSLDKVVMAAMAHNVAMDLLDTVHSDELHGTWFTL